MATYTISDGNNRLDVSRLVAGAYFLRITSDGVSSVQKLVIRLVTTVSFGISGKMFSKHFAAYVVFFRIFAIGFGRPKRAPRGNQVQNLSSPAAVSLNDLRHP